MREWHISEKTAREITATHGTFVAEWLEQKRSRKFKPAGISLEAWLYLAGPIKGYNVVVKDKKRQSPAPAPAPPAPRNMGLSLQPGTKVLTVHPVQMPINKQKTTGGKTSVEKTIIDVTAECSQLLIKNGFDVGFATRLVKQCQLSCTQYSNRPSPVRRLTLPNKPKERYKSKKKWLQAMLHAYPTKCPTPCL